MEPAMTCTWVTDRTGDPGTSWREVGKLRGQGLVQMKLTDQDREAGLGIQSRWVEPAGHRGSEQMEIRTPAGLWMKGSVPREILLMWKMHRTCFLSPYRSL